MKQLNGHVNEEDGRVTKGSAMKVEGAVALVTGANRGLGAAIAQALLDSGVTVYSAARDPGSITNDRLIPVRLDVRNDDDVADAVRRCGDVSIVVNNAGILRASASLAEGAVEAARAEMETNFFGSMRVARASAPILRDNGGGGLARSERTWRSAPRSCRAPIANPTPTAAPS
jgi:NAD(P)-dependent dehydrogenase (short-subunit alcohol dehydrogenase family)